MSLHVRLCIEKLGPQSHPIIVTVLSQARTYIVSFQKKWKEVWHLHQKVVVTGCTKKVLNFNCPRTSANLDPKFPHHHLAFSAKQGQPSSGEGCNVLEMVPTYSLITKPQQYLSLAVHETYECCGWGHKPVCATVWALLDVIVPEVHLNVRSYVHVCTLAHWQYTCTNWNRSTVTKQEFHMVGGYTEYLAKPQNCQKWWVGTYTKMYVHLSEAIQFISEVLKFKLDFRQAPRLHCTYFSCKAHQHTHLRKVT